MKKRQLHHLCLLLFAVPTLLASCEDKPTPPPSSVDSPRTAPEPAHPALHADGFPSGHGSPEGVACDLARSFIDRDASLFLDSCIPPFGEGQSSSEYAAFLDKTSATIEAELLQNMTPRRGPKRILRVFAARPLSHSGPSSYGSATFGFENVMFVDVQVLLHSGGVFENRTLVIQTADRKWYVHPFPAAYPLLSVGLNDEDASTLEFQVSPSTPQ